MQRWPGEAVVAGGRRETPEIFCEERYPGRGERPELYVGETAWRRSGGIQLSCGEFDGGGVVLAEEGAGGHDGGALAFGGVGDPALAVMNGTTDGVTRNVALGPYRGWRSSP